MTLPRKSQPLRGISGVVAVLPGNYAAPNSGNDASISRRSVTGFLPGFPACLFSRLSWSSARRLASHPGATCPAA